MDLFIALTSLIASAACRPGHSGVFHESIRQPFCSVCPHGHCQCRPVGSLRLLRNSSDFHGPLPERAGLVLSLLFFTFCYTSAIKVTKIATAAALLYTAPAIVMVLSAILFKEQLTARKVLCCLLAVVGCAFASGIGGELFAGTSGASAAGSLITPAGLLLGLGAGLGYALYSIFSRIILNRGYSVYTNVCYSFGIAMISFFILACADGSVIQVIESPSRTALGLLCGILTGSLPGRAADYHRAGHRGDPGQRSLSPAALRLGDRRYCDGSRLGHNDERRNKGFLQLTPLRYS